MEEMLQQQWFGNSVQAYLLAALFLTAGWAMIGALHLFGLKRLRQWTSRTTTSLDDMLIDTLEKTGLPLLYMSTLLAAVKSLTLPGLVSRSLSVLWALVVMVAIVRAVLGIVQHLMFNVWASNRPDAIALERQLRSIMPIITALVWGMGLVLLLDNLGFKVTAIMAGLGIGGVAVALAGQAVLADLFSYAAILLDKPFEIDDFIVVGDQKGAVEKIGIKTTRLRSLTGEELIFSNKDLTDSRVRNFKRMQLRRVEFKLGLTYDTSTEKIRKAVAIVKDTITRAGDTRFDRAHFSQYGDWSLVIEAVYFVLSADYNKYMDIQQGINFQIKEAFEKEGIDFAFPTQTIHMAPTLPAKN